MQQYADNKNNNKHALITQTPGNTMQFLRNWWGQLCAQYSKII